MDYRELGERLFGRWAINVVKWNPELVLGRLEGLFASGIRDVTLDEFIEGSMKNNNLMLSVREQDLEKIRDLMVNPDVREIFRKGIKRHLTNDVVMEWLANCSPEIWSYCKNTKGGKAVSDAEAYIIREFRKGVEKVDQICKEVEQEEMSLPMSPSQFAKPYREGKGK